MTGEHQPRHLRADELARANFIEYVRALPRCDGLSLVDLFSLGQALREGADDLDQKYVEIMAEVRLREAKIGAAVVEAAEIQPVNDNQETPKEVI